MALSNPALLNPGPDVKWPSLYMSFAIATVLSNMDAAISAFDTRRAKPQAIKQGMMQQLLAGRVRLTIDSASQ